MVGICVFYCCITNYYQLNDSKLHILSHSFFRLGVWAQPCLGPFLRVSHSCNPWGCGIIRGSTGRVISMLPRVVGRIIISTVGLRYLLYCQLSAEAALRSQERLQFFVTQLLYRLSSNMVACFFSQQVSLSFSSLLKQPYNVVMGVTPITLAMKLLRGVTFHFYHILLVRSMSQVLPPLSRGEN